MARLIRWNTPFTDKQDPSVGFLIINENDEGDILKAIVAPCGIDEYPKYMVDFGEAVAFTCMEEAFSPERDFDAGSFEEKGLSAYQYIDSPWLKSYAPWLDFFGGGKYDRFFHYLIFGADNNIEVVTPTEPTITIIEESGFLRIDYKL